MAPDQIGALLVRLMICGPLLYVGLVLVMDPGSFVRFARALAEVIRTFEQRARGLVWREPLQWGDVSAGSRWGLRISGLGIIVFAFLFLAVGR